MVRVLRHNHDFAMPFEKFGQTSVISVKNAMVAVLRHNRDFAFSFEMFNEKPGDGIASNQKLSISEYLTHSLNR